MKFGSKVSLLTGGTARIGRPAAGRWQRRGDVALTCSNDKGRRISGRGLCPQAVTPPTSPQLLKADVASFRYRIDDWPRPHANPRAPISWSTLPASIPGEVPGDARKRLGLRARPQPKPAASPPSPSPGADRGPAKPGGSVINLIQSQAIRARCAACITDAAMARRFDDSGRWRWSSRLQHR